MFTRGTLLERARRLHGSLTSAEIRALASFAASNTCSHLLLLPRIVCHRRLFVHSDPNTLQNHLSSSNIKVMSFSGEKTVMTTIVLPDSSKLLLLLLFCLIQVKLLHGYRRTVPILGIEFCDT